MANSNGTTRFRFWLWLIRVIGVIVPRRVPAVSPREKRKYLCSGLGVRFCLA
jgi:hypothetical protein